MIPGSLAMISRAYPREERGRAIGLWAAGSAITTAAGPVIGGLALSLGGPELWRWIFAINLPLGIVALLLLRNGIKSDTRRNGQPVDVLGALLAILALGLLAWSLTQLEGRQTSLTTVIAALVGLCALVAFIMQERRTSHAMMPTRLFANATFSAANGATFALYFSLSAILFFLPMLVVAGWGITEIEAAVGFAPLSIFISALSTRFGRLTDKIGPGPVVSMGSIIVAVGYALLALVIPLQSYWYTVVPAMTVVGFGMSMVVAPLSAAVMASADDALSGAASGINNALSRIAGLFSVAAMGSLAGWVYSRSGGQYSYGETRMDADHVAAMGTAFSGIVWVSATLAILAGVLSFWGLRRAA